VWRLTSQAYVVDRFTSSVADRFPQFFFTYGAVYAAENLNGGIGKDKLRERVGDQPRKTVNHVKRSTA